MGYEPFLRTHLNLYIISLENAHIPKNMLYISASEQLGSYQYSLRWTCVEGDVSGYSLGATALWIFLIEVAMAEHIF